MRDPDERDPAGEACELVHEVNNFVTLCSLQVEAALHDGRADELARALRLIAERAEQLAERNRRLRARLAAAALGS